MQRFTRLINFLRRVAGERRRGRIAVRCLTLTLSVTLVTLAAAAASSLPTAHPARIGFDARASAVLVAPASQPVAAQPTVTEGAIDADGERLLAGVDRYATSVLLASVPLDAGDAATRDVLVVSGESLVDAVSAVSVAAARDAAIVLTATDQVPQVVSEFVTRRGFDRVTIGGGTAAVSDTTAGELAALTNDDAPGGRSSGGSGDAAGVERVAGATRYETAVNAARAAGDPGVWCDGRPAALVVSGESLVDGVIAAPVAYAMGLPLLFTEPDALPNAVSDYLDEADITRVVVVGSISDVTGPVLAQLGRADVAVVAFDASTPAARSVELAEAVAHCRTQPVAPGQYALLDAQQPVDGVAAAAALATGLGAHSQSNDLIPILAVNQNDLPQPVADYLADAGQPHETVTLYPLGGVARLTPRVITSAVSAARGNPEGDTNNDDAAGGAGAAEVDVSDAALIAAGLTPGKSDGTGVAVGVGVAIEDDVIRLEPPAGRQVSTTYSAGRSAHVRVPVSKRVDYSDWLVSSGVLDPYLWQPEIPVLEAGVDHDGDGTLSADEKYPLGSPERARYMLASGGQAPPGAMVLSVPDMTTEGVWLNENYRGTAERYPAGIPVPPGGIDRLEVPTFEERDALRQARFEAYSGGDGFGKWSITGQDICGDPTGSRLGMSSTVDDVDCETAADWYLWMCDTMHDPQIASMNAAEGWLELFRRFYAQWESQLPAAWMWSESLEEAAAAEPWHLELGSRRCVYDTAPELDQALTEIALWGSVPDVGYSLGNLFGDRTNPNSGFWNWSSNYLMVLRNVSENAPRSRRITSCDADVRYCSDSNLSSLWSLQALVN